MLDKVMWSGVRILNEILVKGEVLCRGTIW